jgi:hypothetical protein
MNMTRLACVVPILLAFGNGTTALADDAPTPQPATANRLTVVDGSGATFEVPSYQFVAGTQQHPWLTGEVDGAAPHLLVFRENDSTTFAEGVLTLVPVASIRAIEYDYEAKRATLRVAISERVEEDVVLEGSAGVYVGFNALTIAFERDKGEFGVAEVKLEGGVAGGLRALRFSAPQPLAPAVGGLQGRVEVVSKEPLEPRVLQGLVAVYRAGNDTLSGDTLFFRTSLRVPLTRLSRMVAAGNRGKDWRLALPGEPEANYTLLEPARLGEREVQLRGFAGRVRAGWRVFPLHTMAAVTIGEATQEPSAPPTPPREQ